MKCVIIIIFWIECREPNLFNSNNILLSNRFESKIGPVEPLTFHFGCRFDFVYNKIIYVVSKIREREKKKERKGKCNDTTPSSSGHTLVQILEWLVQKCHWILWDVLKSVDVRDVEGCKLVEFSFLIKTKCKPIHRAHGPKCSGIIKKKNNAYVVNDVTDFPQLIYSHIISQKRQQQH